MWQDNLVAMRQLVCNLMAYERVTPEVCITLSSGFLLDIKQARKVLKVDHHELLIALSRDGYTLELKAKGGFKPGLQWLKIGGLQSPDGKNLNVPQQLPFRVIASPLNLPDELQVEHWLRVDKDTFQTLALDHLPKSFIDVIKANERESNQPVDLSFDEKGHPVDVKDVLHRLTEHKPSFVQMLDRQNLRITKPNIQKQDQRTLKPDDFAENKLSRFSYPIRIPAKLHNPHLEVLMSWQIEPDFTDLDLLMFSEGTLETTSSHFTSDFEAIQLRVWPGQTYDLRVRARAGLSSRMEVAWAVFDEG